MCFTLHSKKNLRSKDDKLRYTAAISFETSTCVENQYYEVVSRRMTEANDATKSQF